MGNRTPRGFCFTSKGKTGREGDRSRPKPRNSPSNQPQVDLTRARTEAPPGSVVLCAPNVVPTSSNGPLPDINTTRRYPPLLDIGTTKGSKMEEPPPSRVTLPDTKKYYVVLFDYKSRTKDDLSVIKGDKLEVLKDNDSKWWLVRSVANGATGYVPRVYIEQVDSLNSFPWYFGNMKRYHAEQELLASGLPSSFLLRDSESKPGDFALSILDEGQRIKHYRIRTLDTGGYFITRRTTFSTLPQLVRYYQNDADGLSIRLGLPCPKRHVPALPALSPEDPWEIPRESIQLIRVLGKGNFGEVWEGLWNNSTPVAVKKMKEGSMRKEDFLQEAVIMKKLSHSKLVRLYAVCSHHEPIFIITELMRKGNLVEFLQSDEGRQLQVVHLVDIGAQVASGMAYLEKNNFIHRDLAARNVLVNDERMVKIGDFGLSRLLSEDIYEIGMSSEVKFPVKWTAPEAANYKRFSIKSDVWSFGVFLMEVVTYGRTPYPGMTNKEVLERLSHGYRMSCPSGCHPQMYEIMLRCWSEQPENRPTFESLQWELDEFFVTSSGLYLDTNAS